MYLNIEQIEANGFHESNTWALGKKINGEEVYPGTTENDNTVEEWGPFFRGVSTSGYVVFTSEISSADNELAEVLPSVEDRQFTVFIGEDNSLLNLVANHYNGLYESIIFECNNINTIERLLELIENLDYNYGVIILKNLGNNLHPKHQRLVVSALTNTFPNIQFIVTTHSPLVLSEVSNHSYRILHDGKIYSSQTKTEGRDVNSLLEEIFGVDKRPIAIEQQIGKFYSLLGAGKIQEAEEILSYLTNLMGNTDAEIVRMDSYLDFER